MTILLKTAAKETTTPGTEVRTSSRNITIALNTSPGVTSQSFFLAHNSTESVATSDALFSPCLLYFTNVHLSTLLLLRVSSGW